MDKLKISLAAARVNAEMTQAEVAKTLHVSPNTLVAWEKGKSEPTVSQGRTLAELYKIPIDSLIFLPSESN
nr:MAG TPA: Helix-turn-helix XRE-family like protein [Caudoviricetes sp.]